MTVAVTRTRSPVKGGVYSRVGKKSKTQDPQCSQAMSAWKTSGMTPAIAKVLGNCRAKAHVQKTHEILNRVRSRNAGQGTPTPAPQPGAPARKPAPQPTPAPVTARAGKAATPAPAARKFEKPKAARGEMVAVRREGAGKEARVVTHEGHAAPAHIKASHVPPNWTDVRVSRHADADVLVTGKDAKGRPQTVYSDAFQHRAAAVKFARVKELAQHEPKIAGQIQRARRDHKTREEADALFLIHRQATRPGSERETGGKVKAYGATTLRAEHVVETPEGVRLQFVGKEGVSHNHLIGDQALGKMLVARKKTAESRGGRLFDTNERKLNAFARGLGPGGFTAKDFRTLRATRLAQERIGTHEAPKTVKEYKAKVKDVAEHVSHVLGNRPSQALESYIDPHVFHHWRGASGA